METPVKETTKSVFPFFFYTAMEKGKSQKPVFLYVSSLHTPQGAKAERRGGFKCLSQGTVAQLRSQAVSLAAVRGPKRELLTCGSHS